MIQNGFVINKDDDYLHISVKRNTACGDKFSTCSGGCSAPDIIIKSPTRPGIQIGDRVEIKMKDKIVMKAALLVYLLPIISLFIGVYFGSYVGKDIKGMSLDGLMLISGLVFMVVTIFIIHRVDKLWANKKKLDFVIKKIV